MTGDTVICKHCSLPVEDGQPWHTLAEMHYSCYEAVFGAVRRYPMLLRPEPAYRAPMFEGTRLARAAGGHLVHVVDGATGRALCGHAPVNTSHMMRARGKWNFLPAAWGRDWPKARWSGGLRACQKCADREGAHP